MSKVSERSQRQSPAPGDLYVLRETAGLPVEWAVLERRRGRVLAVAADTNPLVGSADVEIPADTPSGPLSLRCGVGGWVAEAAFASDLRTGALESVYLERARRKRAEVEAGTAAGSPLEREADLDPEYADWTAEVLVPAQSALDRQGGEAEAGAGRSSWLPSRSDLLAAALGLAVVGLSIWSVALKRQLDAPIFGAPAAEVELGDAVRGPEVVSLPRDATHLQLYFVLGAEVKAGERVGLEIRGPGGGTIWTSPSFSAEPAAELSLILPRRLLREGEHQVLLRRLADDRVIEERALRIDLQ